MNERSTEFDKAKALLLKHRVIAWMALGVLVIGTVAATLNDSLGIIQWVQHWRVSRNTSPAAPISTDRKPAPPSTLDREGKGSAKKLGLGEIGSMGDPWPGVVSCFGADIVDTLQSGRAETPPQEVIREATAAEVFEVLARLEGAQRFEENAENLYYGRWVREPGWSGVVVELPQRIGSDWLISIKEKVTPTRATIFARTQAKASADMRVGDIVRVRGRIARISALGTICLNPATVEVWSIAPKGFDR